MRFISTNHCKAGTLKEITSCDAELQHLGIHRTEESASRSIRGKSNTDDMK